MKSFLGIMIVGLILVSCGSNNTYKGTNISQQVSDKTITRASYKQMEQESKVALVIGNKDYEVDSLRYPIKDARKIKDFLEIKGFRVIYAENVESKGKLRRLINQFIAAISKDGIGLFYFSGHGMSAYNKNHLIPTNNSAIIDDRDIEDIGLSVNYLLGKLEDKQNRLNIVMLDACRNTLGKGTSSALGGDSAEGVFIAYATAEGKRAKDDGLFASSFVENGNIKGLTIEEVFKRVRQRVKSVTGQTPFTNSGIIGDFYFSLPSLKNATRYLETSNNIQNSSLQDKMIFSYPKKDTTYNTQVIGPIYTKTQEHTTGRETNIGTKNISLQIAGLRDYDTARHYIKRLELPHGLSAYIERGAMNKVIITGIKSNEEANQLKRNRFPGAFIVRSR